MGLSTRLLAAAVIGVMLAGSGCGRAEPPGQPPSPGLGLTPGDASTVDGRESAGPGALAGTSPTARPKGSRLVRWIRQYAPVGGGGSEHEGAYRALVRGDCGYTLEVARRLPGTTDPGDFPQDGLDEPYEGLFEGAAAACLAAFHRRTDLWPVAVDRRAMVSEAELSCWDREVLAMLRTLVDAYRDDPTTVFTRTAGSGGTPTCPELDGFVPDHGSRSGGYTVEVKGRGLPRSPIELKWGDDGPYVLTIVDSTGRHTFVMPVLPPDAENDGFRVADAPRIEGVDAGFRLDP